MRSIRPMERGDVDAAASILERVLRSGAETPAPGLREWFERALFEHPWVDPDIPSLVAVNRGGHIVGLICSHVRRLRIDVKPARLAASGPLLVTPEARNEAYGALLLRSYLAGPQDLTITDGAVEVVRAMWERLGGVTAPVQCIQWWRFMRPWHPGIARWVLRTGWPLPAAVAGAAEVIGRARLPLGNRRRPKTLTTEPLTAANIIGELPRLMQRMRLIPDYDEPYFSWLLAEVARVTVRGQLRARLVRSDNGRPVGYFVYYLSPGSSSFVLAIAGPDDAATAVVLDALMEDAYAGGAAVVYGRLEPRLLGPLARHPTVFRYGSAALVHSSDTALVGLALSRHAVLTRLEGESWMAPHLGAQVHAGESPAPSRLR